mgnify:CR=1 FL=1
MRRWFLMFLGCVICVETMGLAQFGGEWKAMLQVVPSVALETCILTLKYGVNTSWTISSISEFDTTGLIDQRFELSGAFGPLSVTGGLSFNPSVTDTVVVYYPSACGDPQTEAYALVAPAYKEAWVKTSLALAGAELAFEFHHWAYPYHLEDINDDGEFEYYWPCCPPQTQTYTLFSISTKLPPLSLIINLADCCTGFSFKDAIIALTDVGLCCGLTYDAELYFTKAGFEYFETAIELGICCGISLEVATRFTLDHKEVKVTPKWNGMGQACFAVYGDVLTGDTLLDIQGLEIYGYKLRCDLSTCSYVEILHAFDVDKLEALLKNVKLFEGKEFEYWKFGFCGSGCCGGMYTFGLSVYFQPSGSLFGFTRILADISAPIMANFDLLLSLSVSVTGGTELAVGWSFRF